MDSIFGISMNLILGILAGVMGVCLLAIILIAIFRPVVFKMALRNPPRRKAQTALIVAGLMLATLIISAALTTGDTLDYSIKKIMYDSLGRTDITVGFVGEAGGKGSTSVNNEPIPATLADDLSAQFAGDPDFEAFMPVLTIDVPVINNGTRLGEPSAIVTGLDWNRVDDIGGIQRADGGRIDLSQVGPGQAIISETLATETRTSTGDTVRFFIENQPYDVQVAAIGADSILTGIAFTDEGPSSHGMAMSLEEVQQLTGLEGQARYISVTLPGGVERSLDHADDARDKLEGAIEGTPFGVNPIKADSVAAAEFVGSLFVSIFLILGLFSIAAGVLLIFLIFMMLASERRPEMGMARAVGMRQGQLVQQFLAEGTLYDLGAAFVGAAAGVGIAFVMVAAMNQLFADIGAFSITAHWTFRSLAVAYALGVSVTFVTILFASARAARLNIVSAIRDLPEPQRQRARRPRWNWWKKIPRFGPRVPGIGMYVISLVWFPIEFLPNLLIYPVRFIVWLTRLGAHYVGWESLMIPGGLLLMLWGYARDGESWSLALYSMGLSFVAIGLMLLLRRWLPARAVYSVISFIMLLWWLLPEDNFIWREIFSRITPIDVQGDFEMFFVSGIMMVTFATLLVIWNADVFVWLVSLLGRAFARWVPAVKTAVAYPLASKTKTGLTLAMFSLIIFSMVTMSTLNANFIELFTTDEANGGWDIEVIASPANPIGDLREELAGTDVDVSEFEAVGNVAVIVPDNSQIRLAGETEWKRHFISGVDAEYAAETVMPFKIRATGYESDEAIWQAIATDPSVAVIDTFTAGPREFGDNPDFFKATTIDTGSGVTTMDPVEVELADPGSGRTTTVTIIGVIDDKISMVWGLYLNQQAVLDLSGRPDIQRIFVQLSDTSLEHAQEVSRDIRAALVERGVRAESTKAQLEEEASVANGFLNLIQGFMGLGLLVGVAALGVISFRAVVERRQQIGMLRAIGFQKNMVAASFLIEAMVVAVLGILSGLTLGLILSHTLITSGDIGSDFESFIVPWTQIGVMMILALVAAVLMTIIPSRNAASVPVAEALRYE